MSEPARSEDARRFGEIVCEHEEALYAHAMKLCRNHDMAKDLVQDTFERGLRHQAKFRPEAPMRPWLIVILGNLFTDRMRKKSTAAEIPLGPEHDGVADERDTLPPELLVPPESLRAAVAELESELREIIELHDFQGIRYREIAERLSIPMGTVGTRLKRARECLGKRLRARLDERLPAHGEVANDVT